jgi:predicted transcriptional regulator
MNADKAIEYFKKSKNKAVIVGGDRPDIILAALETPTACVVLTGGLYPNDILLAKAEEMKIQRRYIQYCAKSRQNIRKAACKGGKESKAGSQTY